MRQRKTKLLERDQLVTWALRALGGRAYSTGELREKLRTHAARLEDIEGVLAHLKEAGYLDDRRFAENYAAARLENQGFGKLRVLRDLRQRRVAGKLASDVADRTYDGKEELELVDQFLKRKYRGKQLGPFLADEKNLAAAFRRLRYAGFSAGASIRVLKRYSREQEALDALESSDPGEPQAE